MQLIRMMIGLDLAKGVNKKRVGTLTKLPALEELVFLYLGQETRPDSDTVTARHLLYHELDLVEDGAEGLFA